MKMPVSDVECPMDVDFAPQAAEKIIGSSKANGLLNGATDDGLNGMTPDFFTFNGQNLGHIFDACEDLIGAQIREDLKENLNAYERIKNLQQETEARTKKLRSLIESKNFLFKTPIDHLLPPPPQPKVLNGPVKPVGDGLEVLNVVTVRKGDLPPRGELKRSEICPGMQVWVMKNNIKGVFVEGTVISISNANPEKLYKVRFDETKEIAPKFYTAKQLAYRTNASVILPVGTRIVARFLENAPPNIYAGIIAEPPKVTNKERYLVFYDDGYPWYLEHKDIYVMCAQSTNVSDDVYQKMKMFIHDYLVKYPERPMVKFQVNQMTKTEYKDEWYDSKVLEIDASMVKVIHLKLNKPEWMYRGSTRFAPLYQEMNNALANRQSGRTRRHNIIPRRPHQPYVEYTRESRFVDSGEEDDGFAKLLAARRSDDSENVSTSERPRNTARKSTGRLGHKPLPGEDGYEPDTKAHLGYREIAIPKELKYYQRSKFVSHRCCIICRELQNPNSYIGKISPFAIPLVLGWERQLRKFRKCGAKIIVIYRAPCGRHFRTLKEIDGYLNAVDSKLTIDLFSVDTHLVVLRTFVPREVLVLHKDITAGREPVPVNVVSAYGSVPLPDIIYSSKRYPAEGVTLNEDPEFVVCCDCTDNCKNSAKCGCQQITNYAYNGQLDGNIGYKYKRLTETVLTGIYECNERCKCGPRCTNRVVQLGLKLRLQMFRTKEKGWGIRCLDDIEAGQFICIYAGALLTDAGAEKFGKSDGDEYFAELDHIEVCEKSKEGYEADIMDIEAMEINEVTEEPTSPNVSDADMVSADEDSDFESKHPNVSSTVKDYTTRSKHKNSDATDESSDACGKSAESSRDSFSNSADSYSVVEPLGQELDPLGESENDDIRVRSVAKKSISKKHSSMHLTPKVKPSKYISIREFYNEKDMLYIMDAKKKGNIGRYLNHSCNPNVFVQNVFHRTHDLRFPEVAFFAYHYIQSGTELTWDYNYEIGSVGGKNMICYCDSRNCRGRLL